MKRSCAVLVTSLSLAACSSLNPFKKNEPIDQPEGNFGATSMKVTTSSNAREVLQSVPPESAMERFEVLDLQGRIISYVAFTDTEFGGVVFVDQKLVGTISKHDAQAFYSCRGYTTAAQTHWAKEASAWTAGLLSSAKPATSVQLDFSGKTSMQSIKGVVGSAVVNQVKSLVDMGSNPFSILKTLYSARDNMNERDEFKKILLALSELVPGAEESQVAAIVKPEDVSFVSDGLVMAYPKFSVEFYLSGGVVKVIQQPSFYQLSRTHAALFYAPKAQWALCTPQTWKQAIVDEKKASKAGAKVELRADTKVDAKVNTNAEPKADVKVDLKADVQVESNKEVKTETH